MRAYLIQHLSSPLGPNPVPSGPISSSRCTGYSTAALERMGFKTVLKEKLQCTLNLRMRGILATVAAYS